MYERLVTTCIGMVLIQPSGKWVTSLCGEWRFGVVFSVCGIPEGYWWLVNIDALVVVSWPLPSGLPSGPYQM